MKPAAPPAPAQPPASPSPSYVSPDASAPGTGPPAAPARTAAPPSADAVSPAPPCAPPPTRTAVCRCQSSAARSAPRAPAPARARSAPPAPATASVTSWSPPPLPGSETSAARSSPAARSHTPATRAPLANRPLPTARWPRANAPRGPRCSIPDPNIRSSKQPRLARVALRRHLEVVVRQLGRGAPARRAVEEAELDQVRLVDFLDGLGFLGNRRGDGAHAHRPAAVLLQNRQHDLLVDLVEAIAVHVQQVQRRLRHRRR